RLPQTCSSCRQMLARCHFPVSVLTAWGSYGRSNLDAAVKVLDASGRQVASVQNTNGLAVTGTAALPSAGTYYVAVSGSGSGDPLTTGYSAYASLGQFSLLASYPVNTTTTRSGVAPSLSPALLASQAMTASVSKSVSKVFDVATGTCTCYVSLKVVDVSGTGLAGAAVAGTWTTSLGTTASFKRVSGSTPSALGQPRLGCCCCIAPSVELLTVQ
ncbi:hypothetical protein COO60DRAFT_1671256, partial [Scenedesmus sp. NREL 46B-D3]